MDSYLASFLRPLLAAPHLVPYAILCLNFILFKLLRILLHGLIKGDQESGNKQEDQSKSRLLRLFADELISTCELCADCAELNVVYELHGSLAYGFSLFLLTYLWTDAFGEAHTTPGYLLEDYLLPEEQPAATGKRRDKRLDTNKGPASGALLLRSGSTYARFIGQSLAMPLAWRFASFYWRYHLLEEHKSMLLVEDCKSSLSTSTLNGFLIEFCCCLICRLIELIGHRLLELQLVGKRALSLASSFLCTCLVVLALDSSGGYFNPILASSLEFGCKGVGLHQHALVFWLGPLAGHLGARLIDRRLTRLLPTGGRSQQSSGKSRQSAPIGEPSRRLTRSGSQRKRHAD